MTVTVTSALAGPATARYSNVYGALVDLGVLSGRGAQDVTGSGDPVAPILNAAGFYAPLTHSLVLTRGTGDPTYSRATNAWEFDNEGKLIFVPSGAARFGGARMVRNILGKSEAFDNASHWTPVRATPTNTSSSDPIGGNTAYSLFETAVTNTFHLDNSGYAPIATQNVFTFSVYAKANGRNYVTLDTNFGGIDGYACFNLSNGTIGLNGGGVVAAITNIGNGWYRCSVTDTTASLVSGTARIWISNDGTVYPSYAGDITKGILIWGAQLENVTGQADQTASEYVSVGVLSAPYHGAGVDGVKWFDTNKNGSAISASSLLGCHAEGARTNSLLYSRDFTGTKGVWYPSKTGAAIVNLDFSSSTGWTLEDGYTISGGKLNWAAGTGRNAICVVTGLTVGKTYLAEIAIETVATTQFAMYCPGIDTTAVYSKTGTTGLLFHVFTATGTAHAIYIRNGGAVGSATLDNFVVTESSIVSSTCTGIDNAPNSASTLTAGAADATILQTISMAAAARSFSAYVKRRTGSGNIYITRDGGTSWTDVTSQINSSTWTRVKIENSSVLNPQVGFKIATSGDAIDVDVCQDEAGAFISSPIVTTTAAVTRNAELLDYATTNVSANSTFAGTWNTPTLANSTIRPIIGTKTNSTEGFGKIATSNNFYIANPSEVTTVTGSALTVNTFNKFAGTLNGTTRSISANGGAVSSAADASSWTASKLRINGDGWGGQSQGYLKNVYIWSTALTDAQLQQVTA